jgi:hypothetical protein
MVSNTRVCTLKTVAQTSTHTNQGQEIGARVKYALTLSVLPDDLKIPVVLKADSDYHGEG